MSDELANDRDEQVEELRRMLNDHAECTPECCVVEAIIRRGRAGDDQSVTYDLRCQASDECRMLDSFGRHLLAALLRAWDERKGLRMHLSDLANAAFRIGFDRDTAAVQRHAERVVMWLDGGPEPHSIGTGKPLTNELKRLRCELRLFHEKELEEECACDSCATLYRDEEATGMIERRSPK
jgi:hypothetical protein